MIGEANGSMYIACSNYTIYQQANEGAFGCEVGSPLIPNAACTGACQGYGVRPSTVITPGEPAPAQWRLGGAQRSLGISHLIPRAKMGIDSCLVSSGKVLAGARQKNSQRAPPNRAFALLCDLSRNVTHDSNVTQSRNITSEGNAV